MPSTFDDDAIEVTACDECPALVECRKQIVNGVGPTDAAVLFIGEAPGANEDTEGRPFVGQSGTLLTKTLGKHGIPRSEVRITNTVRCRPPENRDPTTEERANCEPHLINEIAGVDPDVIVTLGKVPSEQVLDDDIPITEVAGETFTRELGDRERLVLASVHPAATMYDPSQSETFETTIATAAEIVGYGDAGQSELTEF